MLKLFETSFKVTCDLGHQVSVLKVHEWCLSKNVDRSELNETLEKKYAPLQPYNIPAIIVQPWCGGYYYGVSPLQVAPENVSSFGFMHTEDAYSVLKIPPATWQAALQCTSKAVKQRLAQKFGTKTSGTSNGLKSCFQKLEEDFKSDDKKTIQQMCNDFGYNDIGHLYKYELVNTLLMHSIQDAHDDTPKLPEAVEVLDNGSKQKKTSASSGYFVFAKHVRSEVVKDNPEFSFAEVQKEIALRWHKLSPSEKDVFKCKTEEVVVAVPVEALVVSKKVTVPKKVKTDVWNTYIGAAIPAHKCLCCKKTTITNTEFHVGHKKSAFDGGELNIDNLRPICAACNTSMGTMNMDEYIVKFGYFT